MANISEVLNKLNERLAPISDTPSLDAQVLLAHVLRQKRSWILAHPEADLSTEQLLAIETHLSRLQAGEPLPYVLGHWEFFGLDFYLNHHTLIPRPETEMLVEQALSWLEQHPQRYRVADIGTGSGCIAVALAVHCPRLEIIASDLSHAALQVAKRNAGSHQVLQRVTFVQCDLIPPATQPLDLICANLPYIPSRVLSTLQVYQQEPSLALDGGSDGLATIRRLLEAARCRIATGGILLLEIHAASWKSVHDHAKSVYPDSDIRVLPDLAGHDRLVCIQLPL